MIKELKDRGVPSQSFCKEMKNTKKNTIKWFLEVGDSYSRIFVFRGLLERNAREKRGLSSICDYTFLKMQ